MGSPSLRSLHPSMAAAAASSRQALTSPARRPIPTIVLESPMNQHSNVKAADIPAAEQFLLQAALRRLDGRLNGVKLKLSVELALANGGEHDGHFATLRRRRFPRRPRIESNFLSVIA